MAQRYKRSPSDDPEPGHRSRKLETKGGKVTSQVPKLRCFRFGRAIIVRYRRRERPWKKPLVDMCLAGVRVRWMVDIILSLEGNYPQVPRCLSTLELLDIVTIHCRSMRAAFRLL